MSRISRVVAGCCVTVLVCALGGACSSGDEGSASKDPSSSAGAGAPDSGAGGSDVGGPTPSTSEEEPSEGESPAGGTAEGAATAQTTVLKRLPGPADSRCVAVGGRRDVRSGGIGAGPFDEATASFRTQQRAGQPATVRLYFIPATGGRQLPGLTVTARNTRTKAEQSLEQKTTSDADAWTFYDTQLPVPEAGEYEIRAVSGDDVGCFRVTFR